MVVLIKIIMMERARSSSLLDIFIDLVNVGYEKVMDDPYIFVLSNLKDGVPISRQLGVSLNTLSLRCQLGI